MTNPSSPRGRLRRRLAVAVALTLATVLTVGSGSATAAKPPKPAKVETVAGASCSLPESDAQSLDIYAEAAAWDHADLTIMLKLHPQTTAGQAAAMRDAIDTWNAVLADCLDGAVSLTEVSSISSADIVLRFSPAAGGAAFLGVAICHGNVSSPSQCNVIVSGGEGAGGITEPSDAKLVYHTALHELGHALGLGHAQPLVETHDLMGYGWLIDGVDPVLSDCDVDTLASIWSWAVAGTDPVVASATSYDCSQS